MREPYLQKLTGMSCGTTTHFAVVGRSAELLIHAARSADSPHRANRFFEMAYEASPSYEMTCPWTGDIIGTQDLGKLFWTCPLCDTEHEEEK